MKKCFVSIFLVLFCSSFLLFSCASNNISDDDDEDDAVETVETVEESDEDNDLETVEEVLAELKDIKSTIKKLKKKLKTYLSKAELKVIGRRLKQLMKRVDKLGNWLDFRRFSRVNTDSFIKKGDDVEEETALED